MAALSPKKGESGHHTNPIPFHWVWTWSAVFEEATLRMGTNELTLLHQKSGNFHLRRSSECCCIGSVEIREVKKKKTKLRVIWCVLV